MRKTCLCAGVALFALATAASAAETMAYKYDARGRLIEVKRTGTVNNNVQVNYTHDKANNRKSVVAIGSPDVTPLPPPPPPNNPPVANADSASSMGKCTLKTVNVTANDTDPDGDPLSVTSATASGDMVATVVSASSVQLESGQTAGAKTISYTISDGRGGSASSTISVTVSGGVCS